MFKKKEISALEKDFSKRMTQNAPMYVYGTEAMSGYYSKLHLKNKKILTIAGSGDPMINAFFTGAKDVIGFDLNYFSYFITSLKFEAIKTLTYKEFLRFFGTKKNKALFDKILLKDPESTDSMWHLSHQHYMLPHAKKFPSDTTHRVN